MAFRRVVFAASPQGVTPTDPQPAGVAGDHQATQVVFELSDALIQPAYIYRVEYIDGANQYDTTGNFRLASGQRSVTVELPIAWTAVGGIGIVQLVVCQNNEAGGETVLYTLPGRLVFEGQSNESTDGAQQIKRGLTALIADTQAASEKAKTAAANADSAASRADTAAGTALTAANAASAAAKTADAAAQRADNTAQTVWNKAQNGEFDGRDGKDGIDGHGLAVLGVYATLTELQAAHPRGERGGAYAVGTAAANDLYVWNEARLQWQNIGNVLGSWTMNDLCLDAGNWTDGSGGWMMDSLCMDGGDWNTAGGAVSTLAEHEVNRSAHENMVLDGNV